MIVIKQEHTLFLDIYATFTFRLMNNSKVYIFYLAISQIITNNTEDSLYSLARIISYAFNVTRHGFNVKKDRYF